MILNGHLYGICNAFNMAMSRRISNSVFRIYIFENYERLSYSNEAPETGCPLLFCRRLILHARVVRRKKINTTRHEFCRHAFLRKKVGVAPGVELMSVAKQILA